MTTALATRVDVDTGELQAFNVTEYVAGLSTGLTVQHQLAAAYDRAVLDLIGPNDVQLEGGRSFKKKSAWRKLQRHFNISTQVISVRHETVGETFLATVTVRATAPWGQAAEAVGACGTDEAVGRRTISMADALATAETRATNRAVSNLIAMGEVSAEEIGERKSYEAPRAASLAAAPASTRAAAAPIVGGEVPPCPKCGGKMWDNRPDKAAGKRSAKSPDFKCRDTSCGEVIWPPRGSASAASLPPAPDYANRFEDEDEGTPF